MSELQLDCLMNLLEDDFDGDYTITRSELLRLLQLAKWNAKIATKSELKMEDDDREVIVKDIRKVSYEVMILDDQLAFRIGNQGFQVNIRPEAYGFGNDREAAMVYLRDELEYALDALAKGEQR